MKKSILLLMVVILFGTTACTTKTNDTNETKQLTPSNKRIHEHCTRTGIVTNGTADLSYEIYYTGEVLNKIESTEKVSSESSDILDQFEQAYRSIHSHYEGLKYYETSVVRTNDSVTSKITIDYDFVDIDELISIEGEENNIFENKVPKVAKWKELAEKVGTKCIGVE